MIPSEVSTGLSSAVPVVDGEIGPIGVACLGETLDQQAASGAD